MKFRIAILIPTYNACGRWEEVLRSIAIQNQKVDKIVVLDSESTDDTVETAKMYGADVITIAKKDFAHGYARHKMVLLSPGYDIYIFLTQDAVLVSRHSIKNIIKAFNDQTVGAAYGRQLPHLNAGIIESHNRYFNYPAQSSIKSKADIPEYGFKTIFCSNSFAAYRNTAYYDAGGFPVGTDFGEDTLLAAKMIIKGWKVAYMADAEVYHSHHYSLYNEFKRYYAIGMFHKQNIWLYKYFGKPSKEGVKYLYSEIKYSFKKNPLQLINVMLKCFSKFLGYKLGFKKDLPFSNTQVPSISSNIQANPKPQLYTVKQHY